MTKKLADNFTINRFQRLWVAGALLLVVALISVVGIYQMYTKKLNPVSSDQRSKIVTIEPGSGVKQIGTQLVDQGLIQSAWALELYAYSKNLNSKFQAGSYALAPNAGTKSIVDILTSGQIETKLVTIIPGKRIDQVRADLINDGFSPAAVDKALEPGQYADLPALALKPENVTSLEGLLWPESFQKDANTDPSAIIRQSLMQLDMRLGPEMRAALAAQNLTPYQGLILASIVEQEVSNDDDRAQAAQVFLKRLRSDMMLGSDVTARYGAIAAGLEASLTYESPYNTLQNKGFPPTPIGAVSLSSLEAVANPAASDWLYFVAGDDGNTYFSKTLEEHNALALKHCFKLCGR